MSALEYTNAWYGSVDADGKMDLEAPGSQNWSSEPGAKPGQTRVTIRGWADYRPNVLLTVRSDDLETTGEGPDLSIKVTDMDKDNDGNWYFGVATRDRSGLVASAFNFVTFATNNNEN